MKRIGNENDYIELSINKDNNKYNSKMLTFSTFLNIIIMNLYVGVVYMKELNYKKIGGHIMELQKVQRTTLTMKEASEYLGISYWLINQLVRRKQIPCSKVGGKYLFRVQALDEYLSKMEKESIDQILKKVRKGGYD